MTSSREMGKESREHSFQLIYQSDGMWFNHQFHLSYINANHWKQLKNLLNTSSDVLLFTTLLKRGPADGHLAILDDTCQQIPFTNIPTVFGKVTWKKDRKPATVNLSIHQTLKKEGKLCVNISNQSQVLLGVNHQRVGTFKTIKGSTSKRSLCGRQKMISLCNDKLSPLSP